MGCGGHPVDLRAPYVLHCFHVMPPISTFCFKGVELELNLALSLLANAFDNGNLAGHPTIAGRRRRARRLGKVPALFSVHDLAAGVFPTSNAVIGPLGVLSYMHSLSLFFVWVDENNACIPQLPRFVCVPFSESCLFITYS